MFRHYARSIPGGADVLFRKHPAELAALLEQAWNFRIHDPSVSLGHPNRRSDEPGLPAYLLEGFPFSAANAATNATLAATRPGTGSVQWDHLIYAYLIENTRIFEIFRKVLYEFRHGEQLGVPLEGSEHWLRNTEELFFRDPAPFFIYSLTSRIRPDVDACRRNAYHRMFGMDLNHGMEGDASYVKAKASNNEFVSTFEEFLREVWIGITNVDNTSGSKSTDDAKIADLAEKLHDMLRARRLSGNLAREEFFFVSMLSWFHLTVESNSAIVLSLRAEAPSPEERLHKVAERVKLPGHALSKHFFDMAEAASTILIQIETGVYNTTAAVPALYTPSAVPGTGPQAAILTIIRGWSATTGRDLKSRKVVSNG